MSDVVRYGVMLTDDGSPTGQLVGWARRRDGREVFDTLLEALEACEDMGWVGYVAEHPDGRRPVGGWK